MVIFLGHIYQFFHSLLSSEEISVWYFKVARLTADILSKSSNITRDSIHKMPALGNGYNFRTKISYDKCLRTKLVILVKVFPVLIVAI